MACPLHTAAVTETSMEECLVIRSIRRMATGEAAGVHSVRRLAGARVVTVRLMAEAVDTDRPTVEVAGMVRRMATVVVATAPLRATRWPAWPCPRQRPQTPP